MRVPDNYDQYIEYEICQETEYEKFRQMWLDGELSDEDFEIISEEFGKEF